MTDHPAQAAPGMTGARRRMFHGAFFLFIVAEAMIFVTLFSSRFLLASAGHPVTINQPLGLAISALLILSLLPLFLALGRVRTGERAAGLLRLSALLGLVAVALIVFDWATLAEPVGSRYGENYVLSTGYHALHIVLGFLGLVIVAAADGRGTYTPEDHWPVHAATVFWTFVVITWIALYAVFFIL